MRPLLPILALAGLTMAAPLRAQEPWDTAFRLSVGTFSGAREAHLGQDTVLGLTLEGAYPVFVRGDLVVQGGYRHLPKVRTETSTWVVEERTEGWCAGLTYRYRLAPGFWDGFYLQGGLMATRLQTHVTQLDRLLDERTRMKGEAQVTLGPTLAVGFRFHDRISLQLGWLRMKSAAPLGSVRSATVMELGLGIHL